MSGFMTSFRDSSSMMTITIYCRSYAWMMAAFTFTSVSLFDNLLFRISQRKEKNNVCSDTNKVWDKQKR